jgi:MFS family permease
MLLVGRAFQGIGCAGPLIITKVILADKVSLAENAKNNTIFTIVAGSGYSIGPVLGGYLTDVSWRWCFIINIPLGVAGLVLAHFVLRSELLGPQRINRLDGDTSTEVPQTFAARLSTIDFGGQFLFLFGLGLLVLALTWGGSYYPWKDVKVLATLIIGVLIFCAFIIWEYFMLPGHALANRSPTRKAMIPIKLLFTRNSGLLIYSNFVTGMAMYAVFYFSDLYFALVLNYSPGKAGTNLIYYMPGLAGKTPLHYLPPPCFLSLFASQLRMLRTLTVGAYTAMFACNIWPLQTFFPLFFGTIIEPLGITLLAVAMNTNHLAMIYGMLALTGVGTGVRLMPRTLHGVAYFPRQIASIVSLMSLAISLGGTIATTVMLNIFNNSLSSSGLSFKSATSSSFDAIKSLPEAELEYLRSRAMRGIVLAFFAITAFMWLGVVAVSRLGNVRIGKKGRPDQVVEKGSFLGSLIWRKGEQQNVEQSA